MRSILKSNAFYLVCFSILLLGSVFLYFQFPKPDFLLWLNEHHSPMADVVFKWGTRLGEEEAYIFFAVLLLFVRFRYAILIPIAGILVTAISYALKSYFLHPRPSIFLTKMGVFDSLHLVDGVHVVGGLTSFPSGHTMGGFVLFSLLAFMVPKRKWLALIALTLASVVGFSRIYLVQHFLEDVIFGMVIGVVLALLFFWAQSVLLRQTHTWADKRIPWFWASKSRA